MEVPSNQDSYCEELNHELSIEQISTRRTFPIDASTEELTPISFAQ